MTACVFALAEMIGLALRNEIASLPFCDAIAVFDATRNAPATVMRGFFRVATGMFCSWQIRIALATGATVGFALAGLIKLFLNLRLDSGQLTGQGFSLFFDLQRRFGISIVTTD